MTLKEKLKKEGFSNVDYLSDLADEFAIGFAKFIDDLIGEYGLLGFSKNFGKKSTKELLEIYKKEKGL
jgi:hypothetical protein